MEVPMAHPEAAGPPSGHVERRAAQVVRNVRIPARPQESVHDLGRQMGRMVERGPSVVVPRVRVGSRPQQDSRCCLVIGDRPVREVKNAIKGRPACFIRRVWIAAGVNKGH